MIKVLFVTYDFPYPLTSGGKNRAYNMMKFALGSDVSIDLFSFVREGFELKNIEKIKEIGINEVHIYKRKKLKSAKTLGSNVLSANSIFKTLYFDKSFENKLIEIVTKNKIDIVHFESSYVGYYISDKLKEMGVKQILGTENIENLLYSEYLKNSANPIKKLTLSYQVKRFKNEEESMMKKADLCLAVTSEESKHIEKVAGRKCLVVENAISVNELKFKFNSKVMNNILFVGNFTYMPNIHAINYFIDEVLPLVDKKIKLTVIGKKGTDVIRKNDQIIVKDFVEDLISEYRNADLMVFPIKIGGGTNYKVLEAMALGVPIVAFPDKVNSIGAKEDVDYYKVKSETEFAERIDFIINNKQNTLKVTENARKLVEKNYSWEKVGMKLANIWKDLNK